MAGRKLRRWCYLVRYATGELSQWEGLRNRWPVGYRGVACSAGPGPRRRYPFVVVKAWPMT